MKNPILLLFILVIGGFLFPGCPDDETPPPPPPPPKVDVFFISGEENNSPFSFKEGVGDQLILDNVHTQTLSNDSCIQHYDVSGTYINFDKEDSIVISFIKVFTDSCPGDVDEFQALFKTGIYPYADSTTQNGAVKISFKDISDKEWTTLLGDQAGSVFEVTEAKPVLTADLKDTRELKGTFNCTLYGLVGDKLTITNGEFYIKLEPDL